MKTYIKKITSIILIFTLILTMFVVSTGTAGAATTGLSIRFYKPSGWGSTIKIHLWNAGSYNTTWPGNTMVNEGNGVYSYTNVNLTGCSIVISDNGSNTNKTIDLTASGAVTVKDNRVFQRPDTPAVIHFRKPSDWGSNVNVYYYTNDSQQTYLKSWSGFSMTNEGTGWYSYTVSDIDANIMRFIFNDGSKQYPAQNQSGILIGSNKEVWVDNGVISTDDYGNTFAKAYVLSDPISNQTRISGELNYVGDVDMFKFTVANSGKYNFYTINAPSTLIGKIYDANGEMLTGGLNTLSYTLEAGKTYYYEAYSAVSSSSALSTYKVWITPPSSVDDYGDTADMAENITGNANDIINQSGELNYIGDVDYFKFTPEKTGEYIISINGDIGSAHLYNNNEALLTDFVNSASNLYDIKYSLTAGQQYYIKVDSADSSEIGEYSIVASPVIVYSEDFEDGQGGWNPYFHGGTMGLDSTGGVDGSQALKIANSTTTTSNFVRSFDGLEPNTKYIFEVDIKGEDIAAVNPAYKTGAVISLSNYVYSEPSEGTFDWKRVKYVLTTDANGQTGIFLHLGFWTTSPYKGTAWFDNASLSKLDDNTMGTATTLTGNTNDFITRKDSLDFAGDQDYFNFTATKTGEYIINTWGKLGMAYLYENDVLLNSWVDNGNSFYNMKRTLTSGKTYSVRINGGSGNLTGKYTLTVSPVVSYTDNFDDYTSYSAKGWSTQAWISSTAAFSIDTTGGVGGSKALRIVNSGSNDASFNRTFTGLEPNTAYTLQVDIKGTDVVKVNGDMVSGVNICQANVSWAHSRETITGTADWKTVKVTMRSDNSGNVTVRLRLGHNSSEYTGTAWFDNLKLSLFNEIQAGGDNIAIYIDNIDYYNNGTARATAAQINKWAENLNKVYLAFEELEDYIPYNGDRVHIFMTNTMTASGVAAFAGNPIQCNMPYGNNFINDIAQNTNAVTRTMIHEISHIFDSPKWNFDTELQAEFKISLILNLLKEGFDGVAPIQMNEYKSTYAEYLARYLNDDGFGRQNGYNQMMNTGRVTYGGEIYKFVQMQQAIDDLQVYKDTFRELNNIPDDEMPSTRSGRMQLFIDTAASISGKDLRGTVFNDVSTVNGLTSLQIILINNPA